jgi:hypothetical protein
MSQIDYFVVRLRKQLEIERIRKEELETLNRGASPAKRDALVDLYQRGMTR